MASLTCFCRYLKIFIFNTCFLLANSVDSRLSFFHITPEHYKDGRATKVVQATDEYHCQISCLREPQCSSVNFKRNKDDNFLHHCELFKSNAQENIAPDKRFDFYEKIIGKSF